MPGEGFNVWCSLSHGIQRSWPGGGGPSIIPGMLELFYHANVIWYCAWHQWTCAKYTEADKLTCLRH